MQVLLFDVETDGLLSDLTRIHCLVIRDAATRQTYRFRRHDGGKVISKLTDNLGVEYADFPAEDTIADGVRMLEAADIIVGHNSVPFDVRAIRKVYPWFQPRGTVRDTLIYSRNMVPDIEKGDYRLNKKGLLPGYLIGSYSLDAWGYRVGLKKGDYKREMERRGLNPWAAWNLPMEDYCVGDIDITEVMWNGTLKDPPPEQCLDGEHAITDLCSVMESNGYPFDVEGAKALSAALQSDYEKLAAEIVPVYGTWIAPASKRLVKPLWDDPKGFNRRKYQQDMLPDVPGEEPRKRTYHKPRPEFGEDASRAVWAQVVVPKKEMRRKKLIPEYVGASGKVYPMHTTLEWRAPDGPYCPIKYQEFNPNSRPQVIDRFTTVHNWEPMEFTDKGNPSVSDSVLRELGEVIPMAVPLAEAFFIKKLVGYLETGNGSWINSYNPKTKCVHPYINTGGTVSGRCSHVGPNIGQVPAVIEADVRKKDGTYNPQVLGPDGRPIADIFLPDGTEKKKIALRGRAGEYGYECRRLFHVPDGWEQVGVDLSGIEFRCLAELTAEFDGGELIRVVTTPGMDIHSYNMQKTGILNRDVIKRVLYGLMYGAGDYKLGITADPSLVLYKDKATALGRSLRAQLMAGLPALRRAIEKVQAQAERGFLIGLDGRRLKCRSTHSALNLRLQSDAALIAKRWAVLTEWYALDAGMDHGWHGEFVMLTFVHDELQNAVRPECSREFGELCVKAAEDAGLDYSFKCPIGAKAKYGRNWAECH